MYRIGSVLLQVDPVKSLTGQPMTQSNLAQWLIEECEKRNLSWAEASRNAGVSPNTISQIVNGVKPGQKRLSALAEYFGASPERVFRMAGLLPDRATTDAQRAELRRKVEHIAELLADLPPDLQDRLAESPPSWTAESSSEEGSVGRRGAGRNP